MIAMTTHTCAYNNGLDELVAVVTCLDHVSPAEKNVSRLLLDIKRHAGCEDGAGVVICNLAMSSYRRLGHGHTFTCIT